MAKNGEMNDFIRQASGRGNRPGVLERLKGTSPLSEDRQERLSGLIARYEEARRRDDLDGAEMADASIDALLDAARAERAQDPPPAPPTTSFDGGVRRPVSHPEPPDMNRVLLQSVAERRAIAAAARDSV